MWPNTWNGNSSSITSTNITVNPVNNMEIRCIRPTAEVFYGLSLFTFAFNAISLPQVVQSKVCHNKYNTTICSNLKDHRHIENNVQSIAASWMSIVPLSALLPALFMVLMVGPISDVIGKKRVMIIPPTIYLIQSLVFITLSQIDDKFSPGFFLFAYSLTGLFGDNSGCTLLSQAYISCITTRDNRTTRLALLESSVFLGALLAAISSGFVLSRFGFTGGFVTTATVNLCNLLYVVFLLPPENVLAPCPATVTTSKEATEAHANLEYKKEDGIEKRRDYQSGSSGSKGSVEDDGHSMVKKLNPVACLRRISDAICKKQRRKRISAILVLFSIALFVNMGEVYMGVLFLKHSPLNLDFTGIGYVLAVQSLLRSFGLVTIPYIAQVLFGFKDIYITMIGFCAQIVYFTALGFSTSVTMLYCVQLIGIPLAVHFAVFRSMVSKLVDPDQYGAAAAALEVADVASSLFTSLFSNQIYSATVRIFAGFALILLGLVAVPGLVGSVIFSIVFKDREFLNEEQQRLLRSVSSEEAETEFNNE